MEECGVTAEQYGNTLGCVGKRSLYCTSENHVKQTGPYDTVILKLLISNMNSQFVTSVYAMLTYLTSYLCKPEHAMSKLMKIHQKRVMEKLLKLKCVQAKYVIKRSLFLGQIFD